MLQPGWGLLAVSFINILTGLVLFVRSRYEDLNPANRYLSAFFVIAGVFGLTFYSIWFFNETWPVVFLFGHAAPLYYLVGPLSWFYVRSIVRDDHRLSAYDLIHFVPFTLHILNLLPYYLMSLDEKVQIAQFVIDSPADVISLNISLFYPTYLNYVFRPIIGFMYASYSLWYVLKSFAPFRDLPKYTRYLKAWILTFNLAQIILFVVLGIFHLTSQVEYNSTKVIDRESTLLVVTGISYVLLSSTPLIFSNLLYGNVESYGGYLGLTPSYTRVTSSTIDPVAAIQGGQIIAPVNKTRLDEIDELISKKLSEQALYLKPDFNVSVLAALIDVPIHHLNFYFKYYRNEKFTDFKANQRIAHALHVRSDEAKRYVSVGELAKLCGYSDEDTFVEDYQRITGLDLEGNSETKEAES